uniref:Uncharacterized protein n=1 Tax=Tetraselmis sp. GSL018 TaxID=582737 RepID=A0A061RIZ9_9CHLO
MFENLDHDTLFYVKSLGQTTPSPHRGRAPDTNSCKDFAPSATTGREKPDTNTRETPKTLDKFQTR